MFASLELKALIFLGMMSISAITSGVITHKVDNARYVALELNYEKAQATAVAAAQAEQKRLDDIATAAAQREAANQSRLAAQAQAALTEVEKHVQSNIHCVTWGLVRVLDAAAQGTTTSSLPAPAGKPDGACASVDALPLARSVVANYFTANANAEQLNALIANLRDMHK